MYRLLIMLLFTARANSEAQSMSYEMHVSRKSRSNSKPLDAGYVYAIENDHPGDFSEYSGRMNYDPYVTKSINTNKGKDEDYLEFSEIYELGKPSSYIKTPSSTIINSEEYKHSDNSKGYTSSRASDAPSVKLIDQSAYIFENPIINKSRPKNSYSDSPPMDYTYNNELPKFSEQPSNFKLSPEYTTPIDSGISHASTVNEYADDLDYDIAKSKAKLDFETLPSKLKAEVAYERLKSFMHYTPPAGATNDMMFPMTMYHHLDENDVRTSTYDSWPYFYQAPYEYEEQFPVPYMGMEMTESPEESYNSNKKQDKRYATHDLSAKIIPVHENPEEDIPVSVSAHTTTDDTNPIVGHQPFFSSMFDQYDPNNEDPVSFKGLDWHDIEYKDESGHPSYDYKPFNEHDKRQSVKSKGESSTEKSYVKQHKYNKHEKGNKANADHKSNYEKSGDKHKGFRQFVDSFANKFGSEDHNKNAKFTLQHNQDKGEKRKGFRRVYHKDEYQEDNEFYDNTSNKANAEESGASNAHIGGSEAVVQSHAVANVGNKAKAYNKSGNDNKSSFENNHHGHDNSEGYNSDYNKYRDVAKNAALNNYNNYYDHH